MVNRIWLKLLGEGLVSSPNNWGITGQEPSHPKLLDQLAVQFMNDGWSIKQTIRRIVLSDAYQRGSQMDTANFGKDPDNRLLWRMTPRTVDAEALRDSVLAVGGGIDLNRPYGSQLAEIGETRLGELGFGQSQLPSDVRYRSVYLAILRDDLPPSLALFDFADPNVTKPKREQTNVPSQALYMLNSAFVQAEAAAMAKDLMAQHRNREAQIRHAFLRAFGRHPDPDDLQAALDFAASYKPVKQVASSARAGGQAQLQRPGQGNRPQGQGQARGQRGQRGQGGMGQGRRPGMGGGGGGRNRTAGSAPKIPAMTPEEQTLAVLCQGLMASAEFRILN